MINQGPKNRILKGDILAFIKGGVSKDYVDLVKKEQFYTMQINLKKANQVIKSGLTINDIIATGVFRASKSITS
jgi:hypothetical protein